MIYVAAHPHFWDVYRVIDVLVGGGSSNLFFCDSTTTNLSPFGVTRFSERIKHIQLCDKRGT